MAYLLDTNVFIQAKNLHYGFDFCPAFWEWLQRQNDRGVVFSIEKMGDELQGHDDALAQWAQARGPAFFLTPDPALLSAFAKLTAWVRTQNYREGAINEFLQVADFYLVAHALAHGHTVVTHEIASSGFKQVKIPSACVGTGVKWMSPYEMLRKERARFVLGS